MTTTETEVTRVTLADGSRGWRVAALVRPGDLVAVTTVVDRRLAWEVATGLPPVLVESRSHYEVARVLWSGRARDGRLSSLVEWVTGPTSTGDDDDSR